MQPDSHPSSAVALLHRRQFVLGATAIAAREDWRTVDCGSAGMLSHCPELRLGHTTDADGAQWTLLGLAIETRADHPDPLAAIAATASTGVPALTMYWAGRWALVGGSYLYNDASGLLGCLFGTDDDGQTWASSSPGLIKRICGDDANPTTPRQVHYETGISWHPPPGSGLPGVRRLLPSQRLDLAAGSVHSRQLLPEIDPARKDSDLLDEISDRLSTALAGLRTQSDKPLWLGLTAGYDSRVMLGVAKASATPVDCFTRVHGRVPLADRVIPRLLAESCNVTHIYKPPTAVPDDRRDMVEAHSANLVSTGDARPFLNGTRDGMTGISFGGHGFAIASGFANWKTLPEKVPAPTDGARQFARRMREPADSAAVDGIRNWLDWVHQTPHAHLDWRDRLFLEQRNAGWLSAKEQLYDMTRLERFPILNSAALYSLILSIDPALRKGAGLQAQLIERLRPDLLRFPFNPSAAHVFFRFPSAAIKTLLSASAPTTLV